MDYFLIDHNINSIDQLGLNSGEWLLDARQMQAGSLRGRNVVVFMPGLDFGFRTTNIAVVETGNVPQRRVSLFFVEPEGSIAIMGSKTDEQSSFVTCFGPRFHVAYLGESRITGISMDLDLLEQYMADHSLERWMQIQKSSAVVVNPLHKKQLQQHITQLTEWFLNLEQRPADIVLRDIHETFSAMVCNYLAEVYEQNPGGNLPRRREQTLNKVLAYIHEHDIREVSIKSVVQQSHTCARNIEYIFKDVLGTTLKSYLIKLRLNAIHRELLQGITASPPSVSTIVKNYGVINVGRFSADYYQMFGEYPRDTIKKRHVHSMTL